MSSISIHKLISLESGLLTAQVKLVYNDLSESLPKMSLEDLTAKETLASNLELKKYIYSCYLYKLEQLQVSSWSQSKNYIDKLIYLIKNETQYRDQIGKILDNLLVRIINSIEDTLDFLSVCQNIAIINEIYMLESSLNAASMQAIQILMSNIAQCEQTYDAHINLLLYLEKLFEFKITVLYYVYGIIGIALTFLSKQNSYLNNKPVTYRDKEKEKIMIKIIRKLATLTEIDYYLYEVVNAFYPTDLETENENENEIDELSDFVSFESIENKYQQKAIKRNEFQLMLHDKKDKSFKKEEISLMMYDGNYNENKVYVKIYNENEEGKGNFKKAEKEIKLYEKFSNHADNYSFIHYFGTCFYKDNEGRQNIAIILQFIKNSLEKYLNSRTEPIEEEKLRRMYNEMILSFQFMHNNKVYHLDIKPDNIMIDDNEKLYIIDFDVSVQDQIEATKSVSVQDSVQGTRGYAHPDIQYMIDTGNFNQNYHKSDADIFSLGMTFLRMAILEGFTNDLNLDGNKSKLNDAIKKVKYQWARDLIKTMLKSRNKGKIGWSIVLSKLQSSLTEVFNQ